MVMCGTRRWGRAVLYVPMQIVGGLTGMIFSNLMFYHEMPRLVAISEITRMGGNHIAEILGTFILILAILMLVQRRSKKISIAWDYWSVVS